MNPFVIFMYMAWILFTFVAWIVGPGMLFGAAEEESCALAIGGLVVTLGAMLSTSFLLSMLD